ncbi:secretin N-terminal domain-containing protein [Poriferisphaera sp. WC338]|uniref:secretin N-terminal domain-containing protein n=1 Tax=Poriferisphaera sp. WC338 TaxID=3425129 RepID=UPI003D81C3DA
MRKQFNRKTDLRYVMNIVEKYSGNVSGLFSIICVMLSLSLGLVSFSSAVRAESEPAPTKSSSKEEPTKADETKKTTAEEEKKKEEDLVSLSINNMEMKQVAKFLSEKMGKPVIPHEKIKSKRITVVSNQKLKFEDALKIMREAMQQSGVIIEEHNNLINLLPIEESNTAMLRVLGAEDDLSAEQDGALIVRKVFKLNDYDVTKVQEAIAPMLASYGQIVADANTKTLMVTDSVSNLQRIEQVIRTLDVPLANQTVKKILVIKEADATWVVGVLRQLLDAPDPNARNRRSRRPSSSRSSGGSSSSSSGENSVVIQQDEGPVMLVPEVSKNWIIAVAPAKTMLQIKEWVKELDQPREEDDAFLLYQLEYADTNDVATQLMAAIQSMPDMKEAVQVVPFGVGRKILVSGSQRGHQLVKMLLEQLDVENASDRIMKAFALKYVDAEVVAENIEKLFDPREVEYQSRWYTSYRRNRNQKTARLKVTSDKRRNTVIVQTDARTMDEIEKTIKEQWDTPVEVEDVMPRIYVLKHADPEQVKDLLENMFSKKLKSSSFSSWWSDTPQTELVPVGKLFGQFSFQAMPDSNRLVVTTKNVENYAVIDNLVKELDRPQEVGLPLIIELKHANAEELAEQLNASLAERGTLAEILRSEPRFDDGQETNSPADYLRGAGNNNNNNQNRNQRNNQAAIMKFWWSAAKGNQNKKAMSYLIGKIRIVPIVRRNALILISPPAYVEPLKELVTTLDRPGMQVIIHAVIAEIQHNDSSTLGMRIASDGELFSSPSLMDQSIRLGGAASFSDIAGKLFTLNGDEASQGTFSANVNMNVLLQMLIKKYGLKIMFEPKLYTADNQEATFFDGQDVPVQTRSQSSSEGSSVTRNFEYVPIGTKLKVRPHITKDGEVDLTVNLVLSRILQGQELFGNPLFDRRETSTHVVISSGQTVMLSGILRQEDFVEERKLPVLGDIPLVGGLFRSTDKSKQNREMIIFITPIVVSNNPVETADVMSEYKESLNKIRASFDEEK